MRKSENWIKMEKGELYDPGDPEILEEQARYQKSGYEWNHLTPDQEDQREGLLKQMFAQVGKGTFIQPPFYANWGGRNVYLGKSVYANFNLTLVDDGMIYIGDFVMIGPNVTIATAEHPIAPELRRKGLQMNKAVHIEKNVWIGAGAIILPGVTIGENSVIGAGSVVTRDIPANVVAVGNPCRVIRSIDREEQ